MSLRLLTRSRFCHLVIGWGIIVSFWPTPAVGAPFPSELASGSLTAAYLDTLIEALEMKIIRAQLEHLGLPREEVDAKLAQLSVAERHYLAEHGEVVGAGGAAGGILIVALIAALVLFTMGFVMMQFVRR